MMQCKNCGSELEVTSYPYVMDGYIPILDVERYECTHCHTRVFTSEQSKALEQSIKDYREKRILKIANRHLPLPQEKTFSMPESPEQVDSMFDWAAEGFRIAKITNFQGEPTLACMSTPTHTALEDAAFPALPSHLWELDGFCVEDMPTVQHAFKALDTEAFVTLLVTKMDVDESIKKEQRALMMDKLKQIRTLEIIPCDDHPIVVLPRHKYIEGSCKESAYELTDIAGYRFSFDATNMMKARMPFDGVPLEEILGWKAWFDLPGIRKTYEAMEELFNRLTHTDAIINTSEPANTKSAYIQQLNNAADRDFLTQISLMLKRMLPAEELETVTFEIDADILAKVTVLVDAQGLTIQNLFNIILHFL